MNIQFTSTLTVEDENRIAPVILKTLGEVLDLLPIAYAIRIETTDANVFHRSRPASRRSSENTGTDGPKPVKA